MVEQLQDGQLSVIWSQGDEQQAPFLRALGLSVRCAAVLADERHPIDAAWLTAITATLMTLEKLILAGMPDESDAMTSTLAVVACIACSGA